MRSPVESKQPGSELQQIRPSTNGPTPAANRHLGYGLGRSARSRIRIEHTRFSDPEGPTARLRLIMDAWFALWMWAPANGTALPTLDEWLGAVELLLGQPSSSDVESSSAPTNSRTAHSSPSSASAGPPSPKSSTGNPGWRVQTDCRDSGVLPLGTRAPVRVRQCRIRHPDREPTMATADVGRASLSRRAGPMVGDCRS